MRGKSIEFDASLHEIAIADLTQFQIMIPTGVIKLQRPKNPLGTSKRIYGDAGWVYQSGRIIGLVQGLRLQSIVSDSSPFKISPRLSTGIPVSFEISAHQPLSEAIAANARFLYRFEQEPGVYFALFQNIKPRFVRIYSFQSSSVLEKLAEQFLVDERNFIQQRQSQLTNVEFYREQFNL
ncbi:MAG: hypothetical protein QNJ46_28590 [Leptolyngbyaceae cyanobacterium MO_188.B28]|nr:hypothetical protein [Leptolyngbyaceae cyanobacterium MO_188.B28]